jgi:F420-0:gamma-glutamyl ligase-like protein
MVALAMSLVVSLVVSTLASEATPARSNGIAYIRLAPSTHSTTVCASKSDVTGAVLGVVLGVVLGAEVRRHVGDDARARRHRWRRMASKGLVHALRPISERLTISAHLGH